MVAFSEEVRRAAPHTPGNLARLHFILTHNDLDARPKVPNGLLEAQKADVRMFEVDDSDDNVEEVGSPQPKATTHVSVEA